MGKKFPRSNTLAYWIIPGDSTIEYLMAILPLYMRSPLPEFLKLQVPSQLLNSSIFPDNIMLLKEKRKKKSKLLHMDLSHRISNDINGSNLPKISTSSFFFLNFSGGFKCNFLKPHNVFCFFIIQSVWDPFRYYFSSWQIFVQIEENVQEEWLLGSIDRTA